MLNATSEFTFIQSKNSISVAKMVQYAITFWKLFLVNDLVYQCSGLTMNFR